MSRNVRGADAATVYDENGNLIPDPRSCDRPKGTAPGECAATPVSGAWSIVVLDDAQSDCANHAVDWRMLALERGDALTNTTTHLERVIRERDEVLARAAALEATVARYKEAESE